MNDAVITCTADRARQLVDTIRAAVTLAKDALIEAYQSRAWIPLGYPDWQALCDAEFGVRVQLPRSDRRELIGEMRTAQMPTRAIAQALEVGETTVRRDLAAAPNGAPDRVIGMDGKSYPVTQPPPEDTPEVKAQQAVVEFAKWATPALSIPSYVTVERAVEMAAINPHFYDRWLRPLIERLGPWIDEVDKRTTDRPTIRRIK